MFDTKTLSQIAFAKFIPQFKPRITRAERLRYRRRNKVRTVCLSYALI